MKGPFGKWLVRVLWPFIRDRVLPVVLEWAKEHAAEILELLWEYIGEIFRRDAKAQAAHAEEQAKYADAEAGRAPDEKTAEAWRQAAEYWRTQYEQTNERLAKNLAAGAEAFSKAQVDLRSTLERAAPEIDVEGGALKLTVGGQSRLLPPS